MVKRDRAVRSQRAGRDTVERTDRVVIIGAGIAGLATALKLQDSGREVWLIERDEPPPTIVAASASESWERPGVPQFRMAHSLLARLHTMLRTQHPQVLHELVAAGVLPCPVRFVLPESQIAGYRAEAGDVDMLHLLGRRATFEYVLRQHVARLSNVRFVHGARVEGLAIEPSGQHLRVCGVSLARGATRETLLGDLVIDASGSRSKTAEWLRERGATIEEETHPSEFAYLCRHYRMRDGGAEPFQRRTGAALDYLWFGAFYAEHGHFALAVACSSNDSALLSKIKTAEGFERMAARLPGMAALLARAEPTSKVMGAGGLTNRWTRYTVPGKPQVLGFFAVGDSHILTNPMYGRGCSAAFVQAQALVETLGATGDPRERAQRYAASARALLAPQFEFSVASEQLFSARGKRSRGEPFPSGARFLDYFTDQVWAPAMVRSPFVARQSVKTIQMQDPASFWARIQLLLWMGLLWAARGFRRVPLLEERTGPSRVELLAELGVSELSASSEPASAVTEH